MRPMTPPHAGPGRDDAGGGGWLREQRTGLAAERILTAAEKVFVERGIAATDMAHIAKAAGCSRATLYRYFENRQALLLAYMNREAMRIAREIGARTADLDDPGERLVAAIIEALRTVRETPVLAAWFGRPDGAHTAELARSSAVLERIGAATLGDPADEEIRAKSRWLVRIIVSLLVTPGESEADERDTIERFVAPV